MLSDRTYQFGPISDKMIRRRYADRGSRKPVRPAPPRQLVIRNWHPIFDLSRRARRVTNANKETTMENRNRLLAAAAAFVFGVTISIAVDTGAAIAQNGNGGYRPGMLGVDTNLRAKSYSPPPATSQPRSTPSTTGTARGTEYRPERQPAYASPPPPPAPSNPPRTTVTATPPDRPTAPGNQIQLNTETRLNKNTSITTTTTGTPPLPAQDVPPPSLNEQTIGVKKEF